MSVGWFSNDKVPDEPRLVSGEPEFGGRPWLLGRPTPRQLPADYQRPVFKIPELSADDPHRFLSVVQFARDLIDYLVETYDVQRRDERRFVHLMPSQGAGLRFKLTEAGGSVRRRGQGWAVCS
ncbi:MAG: hypothetical protein V9G10_16390 [Candidatus Nanopelagicales bacterium]